jgi:hypothetical protein
MDAVSALRAAYAFNLVYAAKLVADLDAAQMVAVPGRGHENHPAFTLGHLCVAAAMVAEDSGAGRDLPGGWTELFERRGPSDRRLPDADAGGYPPKRALLAELERQHGRALAGLDRAGSERLAARAQWRLDLWLPTELDAAMFMCVTHEALHLGQLAAWRRAMGLPAAMAALPRSG